LNNAVKETDRVTQNNSVNSEETAAASEEMKAQTEKIRIFVNELTVLIGKKA
jgi:methyl-accepting chemotaxis protein